MLRLDSVCIIQLAPLGSSACTKVIVVIDGGDSCVASFAIKAAWGDKIVDHDVISLLILRTLDNYMCHRKTLAGVWHPQGIR